MKKIALLIMICCMFTACGTKEEEVKVDVPEQVESTVENVEIVEEVADVKNEEPSDNENKNVYNIACLFLPVAWKIGSAIAIPSGIL